MRVGNFKAYGFQDFLGNGQKRLDHLGIELPPRLPNDFFPGRRVRTRAPIPAVVTQLLMFGISLESVPRRKASRTPSSAATTSD